MPSKDKFKPVVDGVNSVNTAAGTEAKNKVQGYGDDGTVDESLNSGFTSADERFTPKSVTKRS